MIASPEDAVRISISSGLSGCLDDLMQAAKKSTTAEHFKQDVLYWFDLSLECNNCEAAIKCIKLNPFCKRQLNMYFGDYLNLMSSDQLKYIIDAEYNGYIQDKLLTTIAQDSDAKSFQMLLDEYKLPMRQLLRLERSLSQPDAFLVLSADVKQKILNAEFKRV